MELDSYEDHGLEIRFFWRGKDIISVSYNGRKIQFQDCGSRLRILLTQNTYMRLDTSSQKAVIESQPTRHGVLLRKIVFIPIYKRTTVTIPKDKVYNLLRFLNSTITDQF